MITHMEIDKVFLLKIQEIPVRDFKFNTFSFFFLFSFLIDIDPSRLLL